MSEEHVTYDICGSSSREEEDRADCKELRRERIYRCWPYLLDMLQEAVFQELSARGPEEDTRFDMAYVSGPKSVCEEFARRVNQGFGKVIHAVNSKSEITFFKNMKPCTQD